MSVTHSVGDSLAQPHNRGLSRARGCGSAAEVRPELFDELSDLIRFDERAGALILRLNKGYRVATGVCLSLLPARFDSLDDSRHDFTGKLAPLPRDGATFSE